ncbi:MAG: Ig-like domain-containing protein, partial [Gemmatimonadetes bacterium]|nr:Ig-like domain-containing protein [Gemmatimonadota bacterium]
MAPTSCALTTGASCTLAATTADASGRTLTGRAISWTTSAAAVATVSTAGVVTAVAPGAATITATSEGRSGTATITVTPPAVERITVTPSSCALVTGASCTLTAATVDAAGAPLTGRAISWTTSAAAVATVSTAGVVTAVAAGSATITATSEGKSATAAITVTPPPVATITLAPSACIVDPGRGCVPTATLRDAAGNALAGRAVTWSSSATGVATVAADGTVTGVAAGAATVTATSEGRSATLAVTVSNAAAASVVVTVNLAGSGNQLSDLLGVNKAPRLRNPPTVAGGATWDGTSLYAAFGVTNVRTHDTGLDICTTYTAATKLDMLQTPPRAVTGCTMEGAGAPPHLKWTPTSSADSALNNPANYAFADADSTVARITASGARVYLRLGDSFNGPSNTDDPVAWAKVLANIYAHVLGRFKASAVTADPVHVEIMNEPDGGFWKGTKSAFDTLYAQTARRVRAEAAAAGRTVVVGGPGFTAEYLTRQGNPNNVAYRFGTSVGTANVDFLSVHHYNTCSTATLARAAQFLRDTRAYADANGLAGKPLHLTEWNIGLGQDCGNAFFGNQRTQSYASAMLTLLQHPAWQFQAAQFYAGMPIMSLFDFGTAGKVRVNPSAWAFWAHRQLRGATSLPAEVCPGGTGCVAGTASHETPLLAVAGNAAGTRTLVLTNDGTADVTYSLRLAGVPGSTASVSLVTPPREVQELSGSASPVTVSASDLAALLASPTTDTRAALAVSGGSVVLTGVI